MEGITRHTLLREQVLEILRDEILNRRPVGGSMPSELDLVRQLKVSRKTVRAAYAVLEAEGLIERRRGLGTFIIAKTPRSRKTGEIGLIFFSSAEMMFLVPFYARMIGEVCSRASVVPFYVRLLTHDSRLRESRYDWQEHAKRLEEEVAALAVGVYRPEALRSLAQRMPTIAVDTGGPFDFCDSVAADDSEAGRLATQHLLDLGHRHIGFIGGNSVEPDEVPDPAHLRRHEGYLAAMRQAQIWPEDDLHLETRGAGQAIYRATSLALQQPDRPTAFVVVDDEGALAGVDAAVSQGLRVPHDVSFVGIGDAVRSSATVRLTTVAISPETIGRVGVELLQRRLAEPAAPFVHQIVPVNLVERDTTASPAW
jgi:DNA-binding LacI/PurR family transcriptional regulator